MSICLVWATRYRTYEVQGPENVSLDLGVETESVVTDSFDVA
jgi:hypothetical protein